MNKLNKALSAELISIAQNDYMIDGHYLPDGEFLMSVANHLNKKPIDDLIKKLKIKLTVVDKKVDNMLDSGKDSGEFFEGLVDARLELEMDINALKTAKELLIKYMELSPS